jgi:8-amino-7-oxononanoate synthase
MSGALRGLTAAARLKLIERLAQRRAGQERAAGAEPVGEGGKRRFAGLAGMRDFDLFRAALSDLGVESPFFRLHEGRAGPRSVVEGQECLNFSTYDYLGLNGDPRIAAAAKAAVDRYGVSAGASRLVSGERPVHRELEAALAEWHGAEDALVLVSGHATNVTLIGHILGPQDAVLHDAAIHNSCVEGARLSGARRVAFPHNDWAAAGRELSAIRAQHRHVLLVIEGHYSMDGDCPDLARFVDIARRHESWLMVDEAHSLGVLGATGRGIAEAQGVDPREVDIWMGTLSKALCGAGGYIAGPRDLISWLRHTLPGFVYSVGLPPPLAAASRAALDVLRAEPWRVARLAENATALRDGLAARGFDVGASAGRAIVPLLTGSSLKAGRLSDALFRRGVNVQPIVYPAVPDRSARLRFFVSAAHAPEDIAEALEAVSAAAREG